MPGQDPTRQRRSVLMGLSALLATPLMARAQAQTCSRMIQVPIADWGLNSVFPDVLKSLEGGCHFTLTRVPRARLEVMFSNGQGDLLVPATRTALRDQLGDYLPMVQIRPSLVSFDPNRPPSGSFEGMLKQTHLRVAVVRGFDYGGSYQSLKRELAAGQRLVLAVDALDMAHMLDAGLADVALIAPGTLAANLAGGSPHYQRMLPRVHVEVIADLPWVDLGCYLSRLTMSAQDRAVLRTLLERAVSSGRVWKNVQHFYGPGILLDSYRPK